MEKLKQQLEKYLKHLKCNEKGIMVEIMISIITSILYLFDHIDQGSGGGGDYDELEERVDTLEQQVEIGPLTLSNFTVIPSSIELGATVTNLNFSWDLNKNPETLTLNPLGGSLPVTSRTLTQPASLTSETTFTLTATKSGTTRTATTTVRFLSRMYYGTNANTSLTNAQILGLTNVLATGRGRTITLNGNSQYLYIAYPASFGEATFTMNGLVNTAWTKTVTNVINSFGVSVSYNVYRSNTVQNATNINIVIS